VEEQHKTMKMVLRTNCGAYSESWFQSWSQSWSESYYESQSWSKFGHWSRSQSWFWSWCESLSQPCFLFQN
jgi:hypothetical protein